jgi:hypothetical protein
MGIVLAAAALLALPFLAATNQLTTLVANPTPQWPQDGHGENILNTNGDVYSGALAPGLTKHRETAKPFSWHCGKSVDTVRVLEYSNSVIGREVLM